MAKKYLETLTRYNLMLALVEFEKGSRIFRGSEIGSGIEKCHQVINMNGKKTLYNNYQAILTSVGPGGINFTNKLVR